MTIRLPAHSTYNNQSLLMKTVFITLLTLTVFCLSACNKLKLGSLQAKVGQDKTLHESGPLGDDEQIEAGIIDRTRQIYTHVQKVYNDNTSVPDNAILNTSYCSKDWNEKLAQIEEKEKKSNEEMGFFVADYWVMGQDYHEIGTSNYKVEKMLLDTIPSQASVTLNIQNCGNTIPIRVDLVWEKGQWVIDNLTDLTNDFDWKKGMVEYLTEL